MSAIAKYLHTKQAIEKFQKNVRAGECLDDLPMLFGQIIKGVRRTAITLGQGVLLYRCRPHEKGNLFKHVSDLKYAPAERVLKRGRFNEAGESILYCSNTELGTLVEMNPNYETIFTIAIIQPREGASPPWIARFRRADDEDIVLEGGTRHRDAREKLVDSFLMDELSRPGTEYAYAGTIPIGKHMFRKGIMTLDVHGKKIPYLGHQHQAITYPSVRASLYTNVRTYNVAMLPETFDHCFDITGANIYSLTYDKNEDNIRLTSHNYATADKDGLFQWKYSLDEMVDRTSRGVHEHSNSDESLKVAAQYI